MSCLKPVTDALESGASAVRDAVMGGGKRRTHMRKSKKSRGSKKSHRSKKSRRSMKKGGGVISTAMVPFGLLGLQRLLKSRKSNKHHKRSKSAHRTRRR